jgi:hypothetical protein
LLPGAGTFALTIPVHARAVLYSFAASEEVTALNHARIAAAALQFRLTTLQDTLVDPTRFDVDGAASCAVACGDPEIDRAIRQLGHAWTSAGLDPARMCEPWSARDVDRLLAAGGIGVIDALDDIVRGVNCRAVFT